MHLVLTVKINNYIGYNTDHDDKYNIAKKDEYLLQIKPMPASYNVGFTSVAYQGLLNVLNADSHLFYYYGSETTPPCREEVLWIVYGKPRSMSVYQYEFILKQLGKNTDENKKVDEAQDKSQLYGNKREIKVSFT